MVRTLENEARIAGGRVDNLMQALESQKRVVGATDADEVKLRELERQAHLLKEQFEGAAAKYQDALARENAATTPADARIFQRALAPQVPSFPKKAPIVGIATLAALALSIGAILSGELLSSGPRTASHAEIIETPARADAEIFAPPPRTEPEPAPIIDGVVDDPVQVLEHERLAQPLAHEPAMQAQAKDSVADQREIVSTIDAAKPAPVRSRC